MTYFLAGAAGAAVRPLITDERGRAWRMAREIDVTTKSAKKIAVSL